MFQWLWVQIPAPYIGWTFFTFICCKNCNVVWKDENKWKRGLGWPIFLKDWPLNFNLNFYSPEWRRLGMVSRPRVSHPHNRHRLLWHPLRPRRQRLPVSHEGRPCTDQVRLDPDQNLLQEDDGLQGISQYYKTFLHQPTVFVHILRSIVCNLSFSRDPLFLYFCLFLKQITKIICVSAGL